MKEEIIGMDWAPAGVSLYSHAGAELDWSRFTANPTFPAIIQEIVTEGDRLLGEPVPALTQELFDLFELQGTRLEYESVYFARRLRLTTFGLLALLFPQYPQYESALTEIVEDILQESTWCLPAHMRGTPLDKGIDLFAAETGFALAELITLLGSRVAQDQRMRVIQQIEHRLFTPYLTQGPYHWETADHNWASVCAGSIGSAALLLEQDEQRLNGILGKVLRTMEHYLSGFGADGACLEGVGYWNYGFGYYISFADLLYARSKGKLNLFTGEKVQKIALFQQKAYLAGDRTANFSDAADSVRIQPGLSARLAGLFPAFESPPAALRARYTDDHCARFAPALRNLLWLQPADGSQSTKPHWASGSWFLPEAQWLVARHVSSAGRFGFAAKGGHNGEPHNHLDVGHFILLADEDPAFAADLGAGEYTSAYFSDGRYSYVCTNALGHSLPRIGGLVQQPGEACKAEVLNACTGESAAELELELAGTYAIPELVSFIRKFIWTKQELPVLEVADHFRFRQPPGESAIQRGTIEETVITRCRPEPLRDGLIRLSGDQHEVHVFYTADQLTVTIEEEVFSNHYGEPETFWRLLFQEKQPSDKDFITTLKFQFIK